MKTLILLAAILSTTVNAQDWHDDLMRQQPHLYRLEGTDQVLGQPKNQIQYWQQQEAIAQAQENLKRSKDPYYEAVKAAKHQHEVNNYRRSGGRGCRSVSLLGC